MPIFRGVSNTILFIHIPKTGGTSVEKYFSNKYDMDLFTEKIPYVYNFIEFKTSLQHQTLNTILKNKKLFKLTMVNTDVITIVRNPYARLISELFWSNLINKNTTKEAISHVIKKLIDDYKINNSIYDNHIRPQYEFLIYKNKINSNIKILKTENLQGMMYNHGYTDFNIHLLNNNNTDNYMKYLNRNSINLINIFYDEDFKRFNYSKLIN